MIYSKNGLHLTEQFEGCRLVAYQDSGGVWTIGYGRTRGVYAGMTCTQALAEGWLLVDVHIAECEVNRLVRVPVTQLEFDALVDFEFNTGALGKSTMLVLLNAGNYAGAAEQFAKWDHVKGVEIAGLLKRRLAEKAEFTSGMTA